MRLFVDQLTNVDFSYLCPERGLLGETWLAHIELRGDLDEQGMVCDFGKVKKACRQWLDENIDHRLLVPLHAKGVTVSGDQSQTGVHFFSRRGEIECQSPNSALTLIPAREISPELVATWVEQQLATTFGPSVQHVAISFSIEQISGPQYQYSHGLKKHDGNCQRIAHGHRSKLVIWRESELATDLMLQWADLWADIYIGTREDLKHETDTHYFFQYRAHQGDFSLLLPKSCCYLVDTDTTVENLAQHIADTLARNQSHTIVVKAFEGIGKGAIASSTNNP